MLEKKKKIAVMSQGGGLMVVVSTTAFHARVQGSFPGLGGLKKTKMFLPHPRVKLSIDLQCLNFESCVWRAVSSHSSHHPQEILLAQFSLYVHKSGLKPDSFHFILLCRNSMVLPIYNSRNVLALIIIYMYTSGFEISGGPVAQGHQKFCRTTGTLGSSGPTGH